MENTVKDLRNALTHVVQCKNALTYNVTSLLTHP